MTTPHSLPACGIKVLEHLRLLRSQNRGPLAIGIGGGECSGKSYLATHLRDFSKDYGLTIYVIPVDGYLRYSRAERKRIAKRMQGIEAMAYELGDHPSCFDLLQARDDLERLLQGGVLSAVRSYDYDRGVVGFQNIEVRIGNETIVILEGIFALHNVLRDVYRCSYFLEADTKTLLKRYLERHVTPGHADAATIERRFLGAVVNCHKEFIEPTKGDAFLVDTTPS